MKWLESELFVIGQQEVTPTVRLKQENDCVLCSLRIRVLVRSQWPLLFLSLI